VGVPGGDAALGCCSGVGHIGPETQMIQSSLGCQVGSWASLVEDNVIAHRSHDSSALQTVSSSPWGKKQELLEERRVK